MINLTDKQPMTDKQILKAAIAKARKAGFDRLEWVPDAADIILAGWIENGYVEHIIFSDDFARAFWGDDGYCPHCLQVDKSGIRAWQYHLQQLVLQEDRLQYIAQFLEDNQ